MRLIDVRDEAELIGVLGYIHGSDWVPVNDAFAVKDVVDRDDPIVFVSAGEERSASGG